MPPECFISSWLKLVKFPNGAENGSVIFLAYKRGSEEINPVQPFKGYVRNVVIFEWNLRYMNIEYTHRER